MNSLNWKNIFISGVIFATLAVILAVGVYLVRRPQSQNVTSKAAFCSNARWPADPNSACGKATQFPAQDAINVSLTPNFHWDYGGYRPEDNGQCSQPSGCASYGAGIYLDEGSIGNLVASCALPSATSPIKDAPFSCFKAWRDGPLLGSLKPNTKYYWHVTPFYDGVVHAEQTWRYTFTTGSPLPPQDLVCDGLSVLPDDPNITLSSLARQITAKAVGGSGKITYTFNVTNTGGAGNGTLSQTTGDSPSTTWTAPSLTNVSTNQTWTFTATLKDATGTVSGVGRCTTALHYSPQIAGPACQMVQSSKPLNTIQIGDTVTFTGYGSLGTDVGDSIDKIEFTLVKDNAGISTDVVDSVRASEKDAGNLKFWKGTKAYTITQPGSYSVKIRVHWKNGNVWKA